MNKIAIDLTWVRHNKVGGTESCVRNLLDGFTEIDCGDIQFVLLVSKDNYESFKLYEEFSCFEIHVCDVISASTLKRVVWQNTKMGKLLRSMGIERCLEPVYGKPFFGTKGIKFFTVIHDLQAKHYPEYFSKARVAWMKLSWKNAVATSEKVIAISDYVKQDILATYHVPENKVKVIYDAISIDVNDCASDSGLKKYGVEKRGYYYTVSSLFPHKNLKTAIFAIKELKDRQSSAYRPLIVSGIGGSQQAQLKQLIEDNGLQKDIIFTAFVDNAERNMLYKNCKAFIFTSIFEGFGMPPLEAMAFGVPVLTTKKTSLAEVTAGLCNYVDDVMNPQAWADALEQELKVTDKEQVEYLLKRYGKGEIAREYLDLFC